MAEKNVKKEKRQKLNKFGLLFLIVGVVMIASSITLFILGILNNSLKPSDILDPSESVSSGIGNALSSVGYFVGGGLLFVVGVGMASYGVYAVFFAQSQEINNSVSSDNPENKLK
ncbi:MAG: hypothetical protein K2K31_00745 [Clostridia bacterium]|nr:hypothetical protein [Clostridia bacterium]